MDYLFYDFTLANIEPRGSKRGKIAYGNGKETLRFKANGATQIQKEVGGILVLLKTTTV